MFHWLLSFSKNTSTKQDSSDFPHLLRVDQCDILQGEIFITPWESLNNVQHCAMCIVSYQIAAAAQLQLLTKVTNSFSFSNIIKFPISLKSQYCQKQALCFFNLTTNPPLLSTVTPLDTCQLKQTPCTANTFLETNN